MDSILLKIKRDFTTDEAIQCLFKRISELEIEMGILKSEVAEAQDVAERIKTERMLTKKLWTKDEMFAHLHQENEQSKSNSKHYKKSMEEWRNKYFSLVVKESSKQES